MPIHSDSRIVLSVHLNESIIVSLPYKMVRSFWPVGQGAFYSELLTTKITGNRGYDADTLVVYDCGSNDKDSFVTKCISLLEKQCHGRKSIDILFISHFHADHISHIGRLLHNWDNWKVKLVVLPVISPEALMEACLQNYTSNPQQAPFVIGLLQTLFSEKKVGDTRIVRVLPAQDGDSRTEGDQNSYYVDSMLEDSNSDIRSGSSLRFPLWEYIPCNYPTHRSSLLADSLKVNYPDLYQAFLRTDWDDIRTQLSLIPFQDIVHLYEDCYEKCQNEESMTVVSHPLVKTDPQRVATCLYTGDSPFRNKKRLDYIKSFYQCLWKEIGTIQASHHGCGQDNPKDLYDHAVKGVMCYGTKNTYGHPGIDSFIHIATSKGDARIVTEELCKPYTQPIKILY